MKKIILLLIVLFINQTLFSQKIILHRNAGGDQTYQLSSVDSVTFLPFVCGDEIRYEGQTYHTVLISTQCWMKENLNVGTMINSSSDQSNNSVKEKYCYNNDTANCSLYGGYYQWNEAMQYVTNEGAQGICPTGWHIPTLSEYQTLAASANNDGNTLKEINQGTGNGTGTNTTGFSALLVGSRDMSGGNFGGLNDYTIYWVSTYDFGSGYFMRLYSDQSTIQTGYYNVTHGFSVRCIKN